MWQFLIYLLDKDLQLFIFFLTIVAFAVLVLAIVSIYKVLLTIIQKKPKLKYKGAEIGFDDEKENNEKEPQKVEVLDFAKSNYIISTVVSEAVNTGYENCRKRQELFDSQMHNLRDQLNLLQINILRNYNEKQVSTTRDSVTVTTQDLVKAVLEISFEEVVVSPLRDTFVADKLAELTQDELVEKHRTLIETAYTEVKDHIVKKLQNESVKDIRVNLLEALTTHEKDFRRIIVDVLIFAWNEAKKFLAEVGLQNEILTNKVNRLLTGFYKPDQDLPKSWVNSEDATPPANIVGGSK